MRWAAFLWEGASRASGRRPGVSNLLLVVAAARYRPYRFIRPFFLSSANFFVLCSRLCFVVLAHALCLGVPETGVTRTLGSCDFLRSISPAAAALFRSLSVRIL